MSEPLQSIPEVARQTGASREQVRTALKRARLEPVQTMKMGAKLVPLYSPAPAAKVVTDFLAELERTESARIAAQESQRTVDHDAPPALSAIVSAVADLIDRSAFTRDHALAAIEANAADTQALVEQLIEIVKKVSDQNVHLFRALKEMDADHGGRLARLQNTLVSINRGDPVLADASPPPAPPPPPLAPMADAIAKASARTPSAVADALHRAAAKAAPAQPATPRKLARIVVVGLKGSDRAAIEKEFKECFDLVLVDVGTGDPPRSFDATVRNCDRVVLAFGSATMTRVKTALRGSGANVVHVNGGMSRLRDMLTSLYVELNEKEAIS